MSKRLSFSIAVNLLTENFKKNANVVKNSFRSIQMQIVTFAAALGAGGLGLSGLLTRLRDTARETNRVITALKNVSGGTAQFADNLKFLNTIADKYGLEVNGITESFAKFSAAATQANMPMDEQKKIFEALSRASSAFGLTADENKGVMLALSQMMGKGKISSEELRKQMGEKLPIAMQAMAKAAGTSMAGLEKMLKQGKLMSADILPKFADAINEIVPNIDTDNLEASLNRLSNAFGEFTNATGFQNKYKALIDGLTSLVKSAGDNIKNIIVGIVAAIVFVVTNGIKKIWGNYSALASQMEASSTYSNKQLIKATQVRIAAEIELEKAKHTLINAVDSKKIAAKQRLAAAEVALTQAKAAEEIAIEKTRASVQNANEAQLLANKVKTATALADLTRKKVAAEIELENAKLAALIASDNERLASAQRLKAAETNLAKITNKVIAADEAARVAASQAASIKTSSAWSRSFATMRAGAAKLWVSMKSMWASFAPAIILSAIIALIGYFKNLRDESNRIKNIFKEYKKEANNVGNTQEVIMLQKQLSIMNDKTKSQREINAAQEALQKMLGAEKLSQEEINKRVAKRIELLKEAAKAEYYAQKVVSTEDRIKELASSIGLDKDQVEKLAETREKLGNGSSFSIANKSRKIKGSDNYYSQIGAAYRDKGEKGVYDLDAADAAIKETVNLLAVLKDANLELGDSVNKANTITTTTPDTDPDNKALRAAERRMEALRKLDEEDRKRQIDKQKFDIDLQQRSIDQLDDSFEKRTKQTLLNLQKEKLAIEEHQNELLKQQQEHLKNKFVSEKGDDKGFEAYFSDLQKNNFKDKDGNDILPEGLTPEDISKQVALLLDAAQKEHDKGLRDINKDLSTMLKEQELIFASDLERKLADLDSYYNEQLIKAGNNADLIAQIESNRKRSKQEVKVEDKLNKLDFEEQLKQERIAGMESIGMTELVEEKKLEVTKQYIQLKIAALKELADAGDVDAQNQIKLYEASLKKLDTQKPVKSLKALADKAIFETIKKGFEKAGDSAEDAEDKTTSLLGSISEKAGMVANITSELQSMFGGMDEGLDMALEAVGNIAQGFATGGIVGGAMALIGEGMKLFSKASEAAARHQQALKEIEEARLASQRAYNLLLLEQNLLLKEAVTIFGEKQITRAANAIANYRESVGNLKDEMQGDFAPNAAYEQYLEKGASSGSILSKYFSNQLKDYRRQLDNYNKGVAALGNAQIVTGHKKTGLFGWGKGKDLYTSILDIPEYKDLIKANGDIDKAVLQTIIDTRKMSDETKKYLQNLIDLQDQAEAAQEELRNYLQSTFGSLGTDIMTSLENAIKDKGVSAWEAFGEAGSKVIEELGKQIAYELFFAEKFKKLQEQLEGVYGSGKDEADIARESMDLVGNFYQNIGKDMELAQGFMENWQKEAEKYGLNLWKPDSSSTQDSTKGYSTSMDQDTGGAILGRVTGLHETGLRMEALLSTISIDTSNSLSQTVSIANELKKQTEILNDSFQIHKKSYFKIESISEGMEVLGDVKDRLTQIEKNTKGLVSK